MRSCTPPSPSCICVSVDNVRFVGTIIKSLFEGQFYEGEVVELLKPPLMKVKYTTTEIVLNPSCVISFIVYRPPRVGPEYQACIPPCVESDLKNPF